jgi:uncharacterized protein (TIGR02996 family)
MPREAWRDDPEYLGLWRTARQQAEDSAPRLVLADWLEENDHLTDAWRERLHGLTGSAPTIEPEPGIVRVGSVPMGQGAWGRLLAALPADDVLCVFNRDVQAYRYLRKYRGRCGWDVGWSDFSSQTERAHLLAVPRLELLASEQLGPDNWDWAVQHLTGLTHFEAREPVIEHGRLAALMRLPRLRGLSLFGAVTGDTTAIRGLPGLRHLALGPFCYEASRLAELAPQVETLHVDPMKLDEAVHWPRLRSLRMLDAPGEPLLQSKELLALARHPLLECLNVRCGEVNAAAVKALAALPRLRELTLRFESEDLPSLKALATAPALESLTVDGTVDAARLREVVNVRGLRTLTLERVVAGGKELIGIAEMRQLEELRLHGECDDVSALPELARLPYLTKLDVQHLTVPEKTARAVKEACPPWVECLVPEPEEE